jgi:hypothetical protein
VYSTYMLLSKIVSLIQEDFVISVQSIDTVPVPIVFSRIPN